MRSVCGVLYRLIEDLHAAGVKVESIALFMRAWQHCNTADSELERLSQLFAGCEGTGGATLAQVWAQVLGLRYRPWISVLHF